MSTMLPTTATRASDTSSPAHSTQASKSRRVLACVLCQQRKVKCDRKFPCGNCIKARTQCISATQVSRQRRRRFPERELLERLRNYEDLLRQNNIEFEPLHKDLDAAKKPLDVVEGAYYSDVENPEDAGPDDSSLLATGEPESTQEAKNFWYAMSQGLRGLEDDSDSSDVVDEVIVKKAWDQVSINDDHLLFGSRNSTVDISTLHPEPVQVFKLWQVYLDNVNPLLKVTHTPSLQGRIIEAAGDFANIQPTLQALMFSIYCMSILSLTVTDCQAMFGSSKVALLTRYQFGCRQALLDCGFLRCSVRDSLTALYLYLVSVRPSTVPQSLSSMLGIAIRIAKRMGIHSEPALAKCTVLEAEMRRRLWWSLILFVTRIGELASDRTAILSPTWDCRIPLNVNDSEFRQEMKEPPRVQGVSSEALVVVVRGELGEFIRHTKFHLGFVSPTLKHVAKDVQHGTSPELNELAMLEKMIEDKFLKFCDPENPLHYMTIWMTRAYIAKCRLVEHYSRYSTSSVNPMETHVDSAISYALSMLDCDTKIMTSQLTEKFLWMAHFYFPFTAYIQIVQGLKRRPVTDQAERAWDIMSDNYDARFSFSERDDNPFFRIFSKIVLQAWAVREAAFNQSGEMLVTPKIVSAIRHKLRQIARNAEVSQDSGTGKVKAALDISASGFPASTGFGSDTLLYTIEQQDGYPGAEPMGYHNMSEQNLLDFDINQFDGAAMDWSLMTAPASGKSIGLSLPDQHLGRQ